MAASGRLPTLPVASNPNYYTNPYLITRSLRVINANFGIIVSAALRATGGQIPDRRTLGPLFRPSTRYLVTRISSLFL